MKPENLVRQYDLIPSRVLNEEITVIGAGAIGSFVTLSLAKMGFQRLRVFDPDVVDPENLNSQFYPAVTLGMPKVKALQALVRDFTETVIEIHEKRYERGCYAGIVIAAVDSMEVRRRVWEEHKNFGLFTRLVIDPRMGAEVAACYAMDPKSTEDRISYEKTLYSDSQAVQEPCTRKATAYCALGLSAVVANTVKQVLTGTEYTRILQWDFPTNQMQAWNKKLN